VQKLYNYRAMQPVTSINQYETLQPLMAALKSQADQLPKNDLPVDVMGTIQENSHSLPNVTLYNAHGIIDSKNPNSLIAYA
jgi:hypothetical protein